MYSASKLRGWLSAKDEGVSCCLADHFARLNTAHPRLLHSEAPPRTQFNSNAENSGNVLVTATEMKKHLALVLR